MKITYYNNATKYNTLLQNTKRKARTYMQIIAWVLALPVLQLIVTWIGL